MRRSKLLFLAIAITPRRQPVQPKYLLNEYTPIVLAAATDISDWKPSTKVPYTSSVMMVSAGFSFAAICAIRSRVARSSITEGGLDGLTRNSAFTLGSVSFSISSAGNCQVCMPVSDVVLADNSTTSKWNRSRRGISRYGVKIGVMIAMRSPGASRPLTTQLSNT